MTNAQNSSVPDAPTSDELAALIEQDKQRRAQQAQADIRAVCEKYRVRLVGTMSVIGDRVETGVMVLSE